MSAAVHVRFALWLVVAAALVSLASVSTAAAADAVVPRCHVDVNRFSGSTTSVGVWAGLRYDVRYTMKLCSSDSNVGTATITLNGERRNETSRSGTVTITGSGIVHYQVTGPSTGAQVFSSSLCWSATNCTTLCDGVTLGSVGDCTVEKTVMPTMIALFWLVPAAVCGSVLVAFYVKKRKEEREAVLEQRDRDLLTTREDRERGEMRPMTTVRPVPSESDDADTVAVEVAPEPREASEHSAVDIVIEDDSAVRRAAEAEMERDRERDRAAADAADAADAAACMQKKSEELVVREHQQARDAVAQEEQEARHDAEAQEAATRSTLREEQREHGDRTRQAENAAAAAAEEVLWENVRSIEDGEARGRVSIVNDEVSERAVLAQDRALGADTVRRAEADAAAAAARMLRERTQAFGDNEAQQRHVAEQEEQRERDALISSHDKAAAAIREAEAAAASQKLAQDVRDLGAEEAAERDAVAKEEEDDRAQIVSDCQDGAEAIQADEAAAAAAEKLAQDVRDLDTQEAAERDAIARQEEEGRAPLSAERDGGADTIRAAEDAAEAARVAQHLASLEDAERSERVDFMRDEAEERAQLVDGCADGAAAIQQAEDTAAAEQLANDIAALLRDEAHERGEIADEEEARCRELLDDHEKGFSAIVAEWKEAAAQKLANDIAALKQTEAAERAAIEAEERVPHEQYLCEEEEAAERWAINADQEMEIDAVFDTAALQATEMARAAEKAIQRAISAAVTEEATARDGVESEEAEERDQLRDKCDGEANRIRGEEDDRAAAAAKKFAEDVDDMTRQEAAHRDVVEGEEGEARTTLANDYTDAADAIHRAEEAAAADLAEAIAALEEHEVQSREDAERQEEELRAEVVDCHDEGLATILAAAQLARDAANLEDAEVAGRGVVEALEQEEREDILQGCHDDAEAIRQAEAEEAAARHLAEAIHDLENEERHGRDTVATEEENDRAQVVSDCQDGAEAIQADEAAAAAAEKLAQGVRDLDTQEAAERDAIERQEEEERAPLSAERDGGADTIRAAEDAAAAQKFADDVDALEKEEAADRAGVLEEEAEARRSLEAAQAQAERLANAMNALTEDEADDRKDVESNEHDARRRIARDRGNEAKSIKDAEAEAVRRAAAIAAAAAVLASCADEEVDRRERIVAAEAAAAIPLPCVGQELTARAAIVGEEAARRDSVNREERQAGDKARAAEATRKALEDLERQEAAEREAAAKEEPSARAVLLSLKNASLRRIAAKADAAKLQMADCVKEEAAARTEVEDDEEGAWDSMQKSHGRAVKENAKKDVLDATKNYNDEYKALMQKVVDDEDEDDSEPPMPFIGFSLTEDILKGVLIVDGLYKDGPAYQTGIRIGDTLLRIQAKPVRTIAEARFVVGTACSVGRVAPITLVTPTGRQYTVALWIMTAERRFAGKPYFFDVHKHEKLESPGRKSIVEGVEGLRTPSSSRTGSRAHTPRTGQKTPDASRSSRPSPSDNRSAFRTTPRTSVSDSAAADARRRETGSPRSSTTPSSRATATYDANEQTLTPALVAEAERARREAERAARRERSSRR